MARQYGGLTRKYASDGGDELAACLPPDLRHLLSATAAATPSSHHRQTTTQRLQQHGLLRSTAITSAVNSLVNSDGTVRAAADLMADRLFSFEHFRTINLIQFCIHFPYTVCVSKKKKKNHQKINRHLYLVLLAR